MRLIKNQKGFTIVETLIVLAITGVLFVATSVLVSGQIQRYQFRDSALNLEQRLIDVINDVRVGYFDIAETGTNGFPPGQCKQAGPATGNTSAPGMSDCIFVGKKVVVTPGPNASITISSVIATEGVDQLVGEDATPGYGPSNVFKRDDFDSVTKDLPYGLDYAKGDTFYVLFDRFGTNNDPLNSKGEGQSVSIYGVDGANKIAKLSNGFSICANNGNRYASYNLGVNGSSTVELRYSKVAAWGC